MTAIHDVHKQVTTHGAGLNTVPGPEVSILMPVFNTPTAFLAECWESIQNQTFCDWELVLVDDGSRAADTVVEIDRMADDLRVVLLRLGENQGIASALNVGLSRCRGKLVARMDADDKMLPARLMRQVAYMRSHSDVSVLGTQMQEIQWETQRLLPPTQHPEKITMEYIKHQRKTSEIWFINHPTVMLRCREVIKLGGYPSYRVAQDLGLWLKMAHAGMKIRNLPTVELHYRLHPNQISRGKLVAHNEYLEIIAQCWDNQQSGHDEAART